MPHWLRNNIWMRFARAELRVLRYAIWPPQPNTAPANGRSFFMTRDATQMAWAFVVIAVIEALAFHLLFAAIGLKSLWLVLLLADIFIIYTVGVVRSLSRIAAVTLYEDGQLIVRAGVLFQMETHIAQLSAVTNIPEIHPGQRVFKAALLSSPNCVLAFTSPQEAKLLSLVRLKRDAVTLKITAPEDLRRLIAAQLAP